VTIIRTIGVRKKEYLHRKRKGDLKQYPKDYTPISLEI
jgi:hypothetical protein